MEKILTYTLREEDMTATADGLVNLVLKNCVKVTGHEISAAKFTPDGITCDGALIHVSERMKPGQTLRVVLPEEKDETKLIATEGPVRVLYEDEDLIAVDKLPGEVVHPGPGHYTDTIANRITWYLQQQAAAAGDAAKAPSGTGEEESRGEVLSPAAANLSASGTHEFAAPASGLRVIGRLDKETSGVLIYAKNRAAAARLQRQRREGTFIRTYLAVCEGTFPDLPDPDAEGKDTPSPVPYAERGDAVSSTPDSAPYAVPVPADPFGNERLCEETIWYKTGTIDFPLEKEPGVFMRMRVAQEGGLRAVTHYEVLKELNSEEAGTVVADGAEVSRKLKEFHAGKGTESNDGSRGHRQGDAKEEFPANDHIIIEETEDETAQEQAADRSAACSLLRVTIETGRTHQIRVHMAAIGHPLVGDTIYGTHAVQTEDHVKSMPEAGTAQTEDHALLHAAEVRLLQPFTDEPLHIASRLTEEFIRPMMNDTKSRNTCFL